MTKFRITRIERTDYILDRSDVERLLAYGVGEADKYTDEQLARELLQNLPLQYPDDEPAGVGEQLADGFTGHAHEDEFEVEHDYGYALLGESDTKGLTSNCEVQGCTLPVTHNVDGDQLCAEHYHEHWADK